MEVRAGLGLAPRLQLALTPRMRQALLVLQAPQVELAQLLRRELETNPLLEEIESQALGEDAEASSGDEPPAAVASSSGEWEDSGTDSRVAVAAPDWRECMLQQFRLETRDAEAVCVAEYILGCVDERGYLSCPVAEIAALLRRPLAEVERVRQALLRIEPPGIAARDLAECLGAQLAARGAGTGIAARIVATDLEALARHRYAELARRLRVSVTAVRAAADQIRALWPHPGAGRAGSVAVPIWPDLVIREADGRHEILVPDRGLPRLRIAMPLRAGDWNDAATRVFVNQWRIRARWLLHSLAARRRTLLRLAREILTVQGAFFERGVAGLRPLTYRQLAARLELHESTIARAVRGKYVQTPRGVYPLRFFFAKGFDAPARELSVPVAVAQRLRELIAGEDRRRPHTDEVLTRALRREGLRIARRTVAKYRARMRVASAAYRRRP